MACCKSCALGHGCESDKIGGQINFVEGAPVFVQGPEKTLAAFLGGNVVYPGQVTNVLIASIAPMKLPTSIAMKAGDVAMKNAKAYSGSGSIPDDFSPFVLSILALWEDASGMAKDDPTATDYIVYLRGAWKEGRNNPGKVSVDLLQKLSEATGQPKWLEFGIRKIKGSWGVEEEYTPEETPTVSPGNWTLGNGGKLPSPIGRTRVIGYVNPKEGGYV